MSLLVMNSVIIHSIRKSSKIRGKRNANEEGQGQVQGEGQNARKSETQVFATLLLVTFAFLISDNTSLHFILVCSSFQLHCNTL